MLRMLVAVTLLLIQAFAFAAPPQQFVVVYHATRNGQPFATVTETFRQNNGHYRIESVTEGIGVYALFGKRRMLSEGEVGEAGLKPLHFELKQGDSPKKAIFADFDWVAGTLTMKSKGKSSSAPLEKGTQDLLSYAYQFMFVPPHGDAVDIPVTTGKKLRVYHYRVAERDVSLDSAAGTFKTLHLVNAEQADDEKELWLGDEAYHIPVRITLQDENGAKIEQMLTSLHVE